MKTILKAIFVMAVLPVCLFAQEESDSIKRKQSGLDRSAENIFASEERNDSTTDWWEHEMNLHEIVVVGTRTVVKQSPDRIVYLAKNDIYAKGLNGIEVLDRIPRVSVVNDLVSVAGKSSVRYIINGRLLEMSDEAVRLQLKNLRASSIEKIELLTTPPSKYAADTNVAYISITTRNETLGTRGNVWGRGIVRENFSYMLGGNVSHTTRRVELSADVSWSDNKGINDLDRTYTFADHIKTSSRNSRFTNRQFGINGLFKYKFSDRLCAGAIVNVGGIRMKSQISDVTTENGTCLNSYNNSPSRPNNALTLTAFSDWQLDSRGKMLSLTYNYFGKSAKSFAEVTTTGGSEDVSLTDDAHNRYHIHSTKLDATLPLDGFKLETGVAFTGIGNKTSLTVNRYVDNQWVNDPTQSNSFDYDENTVAAYISAEKSFTDSFFGKVGLRYEHTKVKGRQAIAQESHNNSYGYLFPAVTLSWNNQKIGRLSASYSMGITRPNFADLNPFRYYTTTNDYVSGNPDLRHSLAHNAEISYSLKGAYAVLYHSYNNNSIGYVTRFNADGSQYTIPENCINNSKTGLYASYNRSFFGWWGVNVGGEVFHTYAKSKIADFKANDDNSWSGKLELNNTWMLNRSKTLILGLRFSHYFPYHERMVHFERMSLISLDIRYMMLDNRLTLSASVSDPFGWNVTKSIALYNDYSVNTRNNIHSRSFSFGITYNFGRTKVNHVYRDSKERESNRTY